MSYVHKHRFVCRVLLDKTDGGIGDGSGIVIVIGEFFDSGQIAVYRCWFIITASSAQATVIFVKSPLGRIAAIGSIKSSVHCDVPFTAHICAVAIRFHHLGNGGDVFCNLSSVSGAVFIYCRHPSHAGFVLIMSCQQSSTARAASSCIFEQAEAYPVFCQTVYVGSLDFTSVATQIGESHVVT